jgi:hypothetical protein
MEMVMRFFTKIKFAVIGLVILGNIGLGAAQDIREYTVKMTADTIVIDGLLNEKSWENADFTEYFVQQETGQRVAWDTRAKMLWDNNNLYIGFIADDPDVWSTYDIRDSHLWDEEVIEVFCDPNDDRHDYFELEINPIGTELDILFDKSWLEGDSNPKYGWNIIGIKSAIGVIGTVNNYQDIDSVWFCEIAIPFSAIDQKITNPLHNPPQAGESWRLQLARYNRLRDSSGNEIDPDNPETSMWNPTGSEWFHVPEKFGRIYFSEQPVGVEESVSSVLMPDKSYLIGNYPNPFNAVTVFEFFIARNGETIMEILDVNGRVVDVLYDNFLQKGKYTVHWNGARAASGIYFCHLRQGSVSDIRKIILMK